MQEHAKNRDRSVEKSHPGLHQPRSTSHTAVSQRRGPAPTGTEKLNPPAGVIAVVVTQWHAQLTLSSASPSTHSSHHPPSKCKSNNHTPASSIEESLLVPYLSLATLTSRNSPYWASTLLFAVHSSLHQIREHPLPHAARVAATFERIGLLPRRNCWNHAVTPCEVSAFLDRPDLKFLQLIETFQVPFPCHHLKLAAHAPRCTNGDLMQHSKVAKTFARTAAARCGVAIRWQLCGQREGRRRLDVDPDSVQLRLRKATERQESASLPLHVGALWLPSRRIGRLQLDIDRPPALPTTVASAHARQAVTLGG